MSKSEYARWLAFATGVAMLDQATKAAGKIWLTSGEAVAITPFFNLVLTFNPGAAFSFLADAGGWQRPLLTVLAMLACLAFAWLLRKEHVWWTKAAYALLIGGAASNAVDRVYQGAVTDLFDFYVKNWHWPAFNVADSWIVVGVFLLVFAPRLFVQASSRNAAPASKDTRA